jgi:trehalose utilization protein
MQPLRVTVWNEFRHERTMPAVKEIYPDGMHRTIASFLDAPDCAVRTAVLDDPEHGLTEEVLAATDVLVWWGHMFHELVGDAVVDRVQQRVLAGMGLVPLHSAHMSKPFRRLMGTSGRLRWRDDGEEELLWVVAPGHPAVAGLGKPFIRIPVEEMYGEYFDSPQPDEVVLISAFAGGEVFRSGCAFHRGRGRIFYFRPGHEAFPTFHHPDVQAVIRNAVRWAAPGEVVAGAYGRQPPARTAG